MTTLKCPSCHTEIEISQALQGQIEAQVLAAEHEKHALELARVRAEAESKAQAQAESQAKLAQKQLAAERDLMRQANETELELERKKLAAAAEATARRAAADSELLITRLREDSQVATRDAEKLREQLSTLMTELRAERQAKENAQIEAQKHLAEEEVKIREAAAKEADERQRLNLAARDKTIADLTRALEDAQRKAAQGSQQLQGEILELDLETALSDAFRDDLIEPVAKGIRGGDIAQTVRTPRGTVCGVMIWELKRTKNWTDGWIAKLKEDVRAAKANLPIIVTEAMPKHITEDIAHVDGVWLCKPPLAIILGTLLRKSLIDVGRQKSLDATRTTGAEALYNFVTSHEFVQQIEIMVETYQTMRDQVTKERVAFEKLWAQRDKQSRTLLLSTANIIGSMQGQIGGASMPRIKGLELPEIEATTDNLLSIADSANLIEDSEATETGEAKPGEAETDPNPDPDH